MCKFLVTCYTTHSWGTETDEPVEFGTIPQAIDHIKSEMIDGEGSELQVRYSLYQEIPITVERTVTVDVTIL